MNTPWWQIILFICLTLLSIRHEIVLFAVKFRCKELASWTNRLEDAILHHYKDHGLKSPFIGEEDKTE